MDMFEAMKVMQGYPAHWITLAESRGWRPALHLLALMDGDEDEIGLTHPANDLTEEEVESLPGPDQTL
jgi:hypothetical protein